MKLKLLHTGDLHIGMKFNNYAEEIKRKLVAARFNVLAELIEKANKAQCNLFVISGDLFDKVNIKQEDILRVLNLLQRFAGDAVLVLPGNHDYDNGMVELWQKFAANKQGNILLLNEYRPYDLDEFDLDLIVYPAHCDQKHANDNRLSWIKDLTEKPAGAWQIGIAHGALVGLSPDLDDQYFNMSENELIEIGLDLWLLGHTHLPYPLGEEIINRQIFNAGTPEPDGMDCTRDGSAWLIELDEDKSVRAELLETGQYRFFDIAYQIQAEDDFVRLKRELLAGDAARKLVRVKLSGRVSEEVYQAKEKIYTDLRNQLGHLHIDDSQLKMQINQEVIEREFSTGSFPYSLLKELSLDPADDDALQLAYELIKEVRR